MPSGKAVCYGLIVWHLMLSLRVIIFPCFHVSWDPVSYTLKVLKHNCNGHFEASLSANLNCSDVDFLSLPDLPNPGQNENPASSSTPAAATNIVAMEKCRRRRQ
eukprot:2274125-Ditylum_brightwellii.AAC.1